MSLKVSLILLYSSMFHIKQFLTMKDVMNVLNMLLNDFESDDSLEGLIHAIRDLTHLVDPHEYLQTSILVLRYRYGKMLFHFDG